MPHISEPMKSLKKTNIYQRIISVMKEVTYLLKANKAAKGLPYKFVSHDQVTGALHAPMANAGIVCLTDVVNFKQEGNRTLVNINLLLVNADNPDDRVVINSYGYGIDTQDKGIGKAISYATKYALLKCFMLETGDDPERDNIDYKEDVSTQISHANNLMLQLSVTRIAAIEERLEIKFGTKDFSKLNNADLKTVILFLEDEIRKQSRS